MKKFSLKILSLFLIITLILSSFSLFAFAQSTSIESAEFSGNDVTITFNAFESGTAVAAIFSKSKTQMLCSQSAAFDSSNNSLTFSFENEELPYSFVLKVFLLSENNKPLCKAFEKAFGSEEPQITLSLGSVFQFGSYPQSQVTDSELISKLNSLNLNWISYDYFSGTGSFESIASGSFMQYADVSYSGGKFRAVKFSEYRPNQTKLSPSADYSEQDNNGYLTNEIYWFKFEPLSWQLLDEKTGLAVCKNIIDSQAFNNTIFCGSDYEYYVDSSLSALANDYCESSIRQWLNSTFLTDAFSDFEQRLLKSTEIESGISDKIYLLSKSDVLNSSFGFSSDSSEYDTSRRASGTDYAKCQGLWVLDSNDAKGNSYWWLRTSGSNGDYACSVRENGYVNDYYSVYSSCNGVRPAVTINLDLLKEQAQGFSQNETFDLAVSGEEYVLIAVKDASASQMLSCDNLLFIDQKTAESEAVSFTYTLSIDENFEAKIFGKCAHVKSDWIIDKEATCTEKGQKHTECTVCGETIKTSTIAALMHRFKTTEVIEATCQKAGSITQTCSLCGETKTEEIEKSAHNFGSFVTAPTCTADGYTSYTCKECGYSYLSDKVSALGHDFKKAVVEATCEESGSVTYECRTCGYTESENIPALSHEDTDEDGICDFCGIVLSQSADCTCICHKTGFMRFIYQITRFFWKLFKTNQVCSCGVTHY